MKDEQPDETKTKTRGEDKEEEKRLPLVFDRCSAIACFRVEIVGDSLLFRRSWIDY